MSKVIMGDQGEKFLVKDEQKSFHSKYGFLTPDQLKKDKAITNLNKEFSVFDPYFLDLFSKIKRGAQVIPPKDVGCIISETAPQKDWKVVDAGSGSGALALFLSNYVKKVYTFDIREDHMETVNKNIETLGIKNVKAEVGDVYEDIPVKEVDLVVLDLPEPWRALENVKSCLKKGGFFVSYSPCIPQVQDLANEVLNTQGLVCIKNLEVISREWEVHGRKVRPCSRQTISHSGFLSFFRKI